MLRKADRKDFIKALPMYSQHSSKFSVKTGLIKKIIKSKYLTNELYVFEKDNITIGYCTLEREIDDKFDVSVLIGQVLFLEGYDTKENHVAMLNKVTEVASYANLVKILCNKSAENLKEAIFICFNDAAILDLGTTLQFMCKSSKYYDFEKHSSYANLLLEN